MKRISILGSTGSIGKQALEVISLHKLSVMALAAHSNIELLEKQTREFKPKLVCIYNEDLYTELKTRLSDINVKVLTGMEGLCEIAKYSDTDILLNSVVGMVGLLPTLTAIDAGITVALANKETLVAGGKLVMELAKKRNVKILPVDSEHSAIFQALQGNDINQVNKVILTASGGPFFNKTKSELQNVTLEQALNHPNWSMGNKVTIDSSTLMNKGLEFIEAKWLFNLEPSQIEVVVHRQSVVHSAVEYNDYSVIAQMGVPDMKIPIQYALLYPERVECPTKRLSLTDYGTLTFEKPDYETFECLKASIKAIELGGAYPCIVNAANEVAVENFIAKKITFLQIGELITDALSHFSFNEINTYDDVIKFDTKAREYIKSLI
ncbi:MAG TPA: 1-deoxy-D-xylulose-5-phosphate reductoisomerase [Clostridiales bacterium]|nr:1-deoxy-D-xylulose-5-phosphate reductoisomerase [Clostridiales bacterium]